MAQKKWSAYFSGIRWRRWGGGDSCHKWPVYLGRYCNIAAVGAGAAFIEITVLKWKEQKPAFFGIEIMRWNGRSPFLISSLFSLYFRFENFDAIGGDNLGGTKSGVIHLDLLFLSSAALTCAHYFINISLNIPPHNFQNAGIRFSLLNLSWFAQNGLMIKKNKWRVLLKRFISQKTHLLSILFFINLLIIWSIY